MKAAVIVLGDVARSPRMLYHVSSLAAKGMQVKLVGYGGMAPPPSIAENKSIELVYLSKVPAWIGKLPRLLEYVIKTIFQALTLFFCLLLLGRVDFVLIQNPPAIPTLPIAYLYAFLVRARFMIDFHNYAYTRLAHTMHSKKHPLVRVSRYVEHTYARLADLLFCVSHAMRDDLQNNWNVKNVTTLYDRPPSKFRRLSTAESHALFVKLGGEYPIFRCQSLVDNANSETETRFTHLNASKVEWREDRPALLLSSTSWSDDEDFGILFDALTKYEESFGAAKSKGRQANGNGEQPDIVCVITGRGPLRDFYLDEIARREWHHVSFCTPWLSEEDYPALLGAADFGVCLHSSTSGLDLPMKVVDMFGAALPTLALNYECIGELLQVNQFGLLFDSSDTLLHCIKTILRGFPNECHQLKTMRENLQSKFQTRWNEEWKRACWSQIEALCYPKQQ